MVLSWLSSNLLWVCVCVCFFRHCDFNLMTTKLGLISRINLIFNAIKWSGSFLFPYKINAHFGTFHVVNRLIYHFGDCFSLRFFFLVYLTFFQILCVCRFVCQLSSALVSMCFSKSYKHTLCANDSAKDTQTWHRTNEVLCGCKRMWINVVIIDNNYSEDTRNEMSAVEVEIVISSCSR